MGILETMADAGIAELIEGFSRTAGPVYARDRERLATAQARREERLGYKTDSVEQLLTNARNVQPDLTEEQEQQITKRLVALPQNDLDDLVQFGFRGGQVLTFTQVQPDQQVKGIPIGGGFAATIADTATVRPTTLADREFNALIELQNIPSDKAYQWGLANPEKLELARSQYFGSGNRLSVIKSILTNNGLLNKETFGDDEKDAIYTITETGAQVLVREYGVKYSEARESGNRINMNKIKNMESHINDLYNSRRVYELGVNLLRGYQAGSPQARELVDNALEDAKNTGNKFNKIDNEYGTNNIVDTPVPAGKIPSVLVGIMKEEFSPAQLQAKNIKQQGRPSRFVTQNRTTTQVIENLADTIITQSNDAFADYKQYIIEMLEMSFQELD
tara:strand:- start:4446 stop:5615 length:1170 start_codon:yes stop_codon:yes gene_type:complete